MRIKIFGAVAIIAALAPATAAIERTALPPFDLVLADGRAVSSATLVRDGQWLVVLIQPACRPCEALLGLVNKTEHPTMPARIVVVAGGIDAAALGALMQRFPDLADAGWYADPSGKAAASLRASSAVAIV